MNTVLDDNKMLCLSNGERIKLGNTVHMVFEVNLPTKYLILIHSGRESEACLACHS